MTFVTKKINIITRTTTTRKGNKMKRLNRKEVAEIVNNFGNYSGWAEKYWSLSRYGKGNTEIEQHYYERAYLYWNHMKNEMEIRLAEMNIFIHEDISEKCLADWDWSEASAEFNRLHYNFREARKAYEAEQEQHKEQDQEQSTGAVA